MTPIRALLVANRGEIAVRIIRAGKARGIKTIAVHSDADAGAMHVRQADMAVRIGPAPAPESYLNIPAILDAAQAAGADAVHPGYGFLSENAGFARAVIEAGLVWVGPPPAAIAAMGDKAKAREAMIAAGVPVAPGWQGEADDTALLAEAETLGWPVLIKAAAGGGGRGMRAVARAADFPEALASARREAQSAFGDGAVLLEKLIAPARHVEVQILADRHGACLSLGERECSVQRRRQKVIEEAPSPAVDTDLRARLNDAAIAAARAVDYEGAGTVEFLLDAEGRHYFLEMNTRLQVEHPVTEMVTGLDLVDLQIAIAEGRPLPFSQNDVRIEGHAIEARLYAEDPRAGFAPRPGPVLHFEPSGARADAGVESGDAVSAHYDPMVAKIIAHGPDRGTAIARLLAALEASPLLGTVTNRGFLIDVLDTDEFASGAVFTGDLDAWAEAGTGPFAEREAPFEAMALFALLTCAPRPGVVRSKSVTAFGLPVEADGARTELRVGQTGPGAVTVRLGGREAALALVSREGAAVRWRQDGIARAGFAVEDETGALHIAIGGRDSVIAKPSPFGEAAGADPGRVLAPVTGLVARVLVSPGDIVEAGQTLAVMEAMKMEMRLDAAVAGTVTEVHAREGAQAAGGSLLIALAPGDDAA
ncbi:ATP-grasp domain-containing protein [Glycocaulis profundi]|nr:ATP-grasp domain-containing protein [Glycocaulis profundi]